MTGILLKAALSPTHSLTQTSDLRLRNRWVVNQVVLAGLYLMTSSRHPSFWLLSCLYMMSGGSSAAWVGTLSLNLKPTGVTQKQAGWIGFYSFVTMCVSVLLTARLGDRFPRHMKWFISGLSLITAGCFLPVTMASTKLLTLSLPMLYGLVIIGVVAGGSTIPLFFELGCELTYPIGEGTANGVLNLFYHIGALTCLLAYMIPQLGRVWLNWAVVVTFAVTSPLVLLLKERHLRLEVDRSVQEDTSRVIDPSLS
ncbi:solute carrier family 49 member 4 homolog [Haliotis rufescens]|uniref:solute carrier family 49 member 4 homolog n=1 Tax=Haliotis rufescens TaxID=6454 RepID=UPI00201EC043|nr:solute carrier family 49 member 4 homolog [Haliotis rufescens]